MSPALERIRAIRDDVPADQSVARAALGEVLTVLEAEEEQLARPSVRAALIRMVDETFETHHTLSSEAGPAEWDYTLSEPTIEAVEQALRALEVPA